MSDDSSVDPSSIRAAMRGIESVYAAGVIHPDVGAALAAFDPRLDDVAMVNLVTRLAPMGAVSAEVAVATFYNANPELITSVIPAIWTVASPAELLEAQLAAFAPALENGVRSMPERDLAELALLSRRAGDAAAQHPEGRPLFAGLASLAWPDEPQLVIWHAAKMLREHRGDGHVATLTVEALTGVDALVVHAAFDGIPPDALRLSRRWGDAPWSESIERLRSRGWLSADESPTLTELGRERREAMEQRTNKLALPAFESLGADGVARMTELGHSLTVALTAADMVPAHYRRTT